MGPYFLQNQEFEFSAQICSPETPGGGKLGYDNTTDFWLCGNGVCDTTGMFCVCDKGYQWDMVLGITPLCEWRKSDMDKVLISMVVVALFSISLAILKLFLFVKTFSACTTKRERKYALYGVLNEILWVMIPLNLIFVQRRYGLCQLTLFCLYLYIMTNVILMRKIDEVIVPVYGMAMKDSASARRLLWRIVNIFLPVQYMVLISFEIRAEINQSGTQHTMVAVWTFILVSAAVALVFGVLADLMRKLQNAVEDLIDTRNKMVVVSDNELRMVQVLEKARQFKAIFIAMSLMTVPIVAYFALALIIWGPTFPYKSASGLLVIYFGWTTGLISLHLVEMYEIFKRNSSNNKSTNDASATSRSSKFQYTTKKASLRKKNSSFISDSKPYKLSSTHFSHHEPEEYFEDEEVDGAVEDMI